jgi:hypothetical protein
MAALYSGLIISLSFGRNEKQKWWEKTEEGGGGLSNWGRMTRLRTISSYRFPEQPLSLSLSLRFVSDWFFLFKSCPFPSWFSSQHIPALWGYRLTSMLKMHYINQVLSHSDVASSLVINLNSLSTFSDPFTHAGDLKCFIESISNQLQEVKRTHNQTWLSTRLH